MTPDLLDVLIEPTSLPSLSPQAQGRIVSHARHAALLGYLEARIDPADVGGKLADQLQGARIQADYFDTQMSWEIRCLEQVLDALEGPVVLLKGAAYKALDLGLARGRLASDVDLLLPKNQLETAEALLVDAGWQQMKADEYDQHYYRDWMHELPPLQNVERGTVVDLHHNILPPTARLKPDADRLLASARPIPGSKLYTLAPVDTLLHRCAHLFVDGDMHNSLRELVDIRGMLAIYQQDEGFRAELVPRAIELNLDLPLFYAVHFCVKLLRWEAPPQWIEALEGRAGPSSVVTRWLMEQQLLATDPCASSWIQGLAGWLLFVRSHWMRMPLGMLARHLFTQTRRRGGLKAGGV